MKGKVKIFGILRGFGYITGENGQDYYVHYSDTWVNDSQRGLVLYEGQEVEFNPVESKKGLQAIQVKILRCAE